MFCCDFTFHPCGKKHSYPSRKARQYRSDNSQTDKTVSVRVAILAFGSQTEFLCTSDYRKETTILIGFRASLVGSSANSMISDKHPTYIQLNLVRFADRNL